MSPQQVLLNDALQHQRGQPVIPHSFRVNNGHRAVAGQRGRQGRQQVLRLWREDTPGRAARGGRSRWGRDDQQAQLPGRLVCRFALNSTPAQYTPACRPRSALLLSHHTPYLQAVELADQYGFLLVLLAAQLVDLIQAVRQVLPAALPVGRHAAWLAAGLAAGTAAARRHV